MTDFKEKYEKLKKAARVLIKRVDERTWDIGACHLSTAYRELKAALRPNQEDIADYLEKHNKWRRGGNDAMQSPKELGDYIDYAVEELRK